MPHTILLYYKYVSIENPQEFLEEHRALCQKLNLKGRIIIAHEGINGTVEGLDEDTKKYEEAVISDSRFSDMIFKRSEGTGEAFPKLSIKVRPEIVSLHLGDDDINPNELTGTHLDPTELHNWYENGDDFVVVDMRNDYEFEVGRFKNSIIPEGLENFRDLPNALPSIEHLKDKKVVTVCTGGVRCEKASGFLIKKGFKDVYQLDGGMATYMQRHPAKHFHGKLYVFDNRIVVGDGVDDPNLIVGKCGLCKTPCERFVNCDNKKCNLHFICCENCSDEEGFSFCSEKCTEIFSISKSC